MFRGSREWPDTTPGLEMYARINERLRQESARVAALTDAERAREEAEKERQMNELVESMHKASNDFMQALLAAQEAAKGAGHE